MTRRTPPIGDPPDPAPEYTDWINHRYDPGYYTGGRMPPHIKTKPGERASNGGWVLIVSALLALALLVGEIRQGTRPGVVAVTSAFIIIQFIAGIRLLRAATRRDDRE